MGTDHLGGGAGDPHRVDGLTVAKLQRAAAQLRRASHSGEQHRVDHLNEIHGMAFAMGRWTSIGSDDGEVLRWLMSMHRIDFGYVCEAPELMPAGSMVSEEIERDWFVGMPSVVTREPS